MLRLSDLLNPVKEEGTNVAGKLRQTCEACRKHHVACVLRKGHQSCSRCSRLVGIFQFCHRLADEKMETEQEMRIQTGCRM